MPFWQARRAILSHPDHHQRLGMKQMRARSPPSGSERGSSEIDREREGEEEWRGTRTRRTPLVRCCRSWALAAQASPWPGQTGRECLQRHCTLPHAQTKKRERGRGRRIRRGIRLKWCCLSRQLLQLQGRQGRRERHWKQPQRPWVLALLLLLVQLLVVAVLLPLWCLNRLKLERQATPCACPLLIVTLVTVTALMGIAWWQLLHPLSPLPTTLSISSSSRLTLACLPTSSAQ